MTTPVMPPFATTDATYPANVRTEATKRDFVDPIWAAHFNLIQNEIKATQQTLGVWPQVATDDPAHRRPNYGTVANRIDKIARAEQMVSYVAANTSVEIPANTWYRPTFDNPDDSHGAAHATGLRIPQTGYWVISVKADWTSTDTTLSRGAVRVVSLEIDEHDVGLRRALKEDAYTASTPTTHFVWQEALAEDTDISVSVCTYLPAPGDPAIPPGCPGGFPVPPSRSSEYPIPFDISDWLGEPPGDDAPGETFPVKVYLRAHLVRCLSEAQLDLTTDFAYIPPPPKLDPPPGPVTPPQPVPRPPRQPERFDNGYDPVVKIQYVNYDNTIYPPDLQGGYYSEAAWIDYSTNFYRDAAADTRYY